MRVTEIIKPLYDGEYDKISRAILQAAAERGIAGHKRNEIAIKTGFADVRVNTLEWLTQQAFHALNISVNPAGNPLCEELHVKNINGVEVTGHPDFKNTFETVDYKFIDELKPQVALQLDLYDRLGNLTPTRYFAFHYPSNDRGLLVYEVPEKAKPELRRINDELIEYAKNGQKEAMHLLDIKYEWQILQEQQDILRLVGSWLPEMSLVCQEDIVAIAPIVIAMSVASKSVDFLRAEIARYMKANDVTKIEGLDHIITLRSRKNAIYDGTYKAESQALKEKHKTGECTVSEFIEVKRC